MSQFKLSKFLNDKSLNFSEQTISEIAQQTIGQSSNDLWRRMRHNRLTASIFGKAIRASESNSNSQTQYVIDMVSGVNRVPKVPPIVWGKEHEKDAIKDYIKATHSRVEPTGRWVFPNGFLAASPDGIIYEENNPFPCGILEVKCPYYCRFMSFQEMKDLGKWPAYLTESGDLKDTSDYYHQVQGELYGTRAPWCDFVVWTTKECLFNRIYPSNLWRQLYLPKLVDFYIEFILRKHVEILTIGGTH